MEGALKSLMHHRDDKAPKPDFSQALAVAIESSWKLGVIPGTFDLNVPRHTVVRRTPRIPRFFRRFFASELKLVRSPG